MDDDYEREKDGNTTTLTFNDTTMLALLYNIFGHDFSHDFNKSAAGKRLGTLKDQLRELARLHTGGSFISGLVDDKKGIYLRFLRDENDSLLPPSSKSDVNIEAIEQIEHSIRDIFYTDDLNADDLCKLIYKGGSITRSRMIVIQEYIEYIEEIKFRFLYSTALPESLKVGRGGGGKIKKQVGGDINEYFDTSIRNVLLNNYIDNKNKNIEYSNLSYLFYLLYDSINNSYESISSLDNFNSYLLQNMLIYCLMVDDIIDKSETKIVDSVNNLIETMNKNNFSKEELKIDTLVTQVQVPEELEAQAAQSRQSAQTKEKKSSIWNLFPFLGGNKKMRGGGYTARAEQTLDSINSDLNVTLFEQLLKDAEGIQTKQSLDDFITTLKRIDYDAIQIKMLSYYDSGKKTKNVEYIISNIQKSKLKLQNLNVISNLTRTKIIAQVTSIKRSLNDFFFKFYDELKKYVIGLEQKKAAKGLSSAKNPEVGKDVDPLKLTKEESDMTNVICQMVVKGVLEFFPNDVSIIGTTDTTNQKNFLSLQHGILNELSEGKGFSNLDDRLIDGFKDIYRTEIKADPTTLLKDEVIRKIGSFINNKHVINNAAELSLLGFDNKQLLCPPSSIVDSMPTCSYNKSITTDSNFVPKSMYFRLESPSYYYQGYSTLVNTKTLAQAGAPSDFDFDLVVGFDAGYRDGVNFIGPKFKRTKLKTADILKAVVVFGQVCNEVIRLWSSIDSTTPNIKRVQTELFQNSKAFIDIVQIGAFKNIGDLFQQINMIALNGAFVSDSSKQGYQGIKVRDSGINNKLFQTNPSYFNEDNLIIGMNNDRPAAVFGMVAAIETTTPQFLRKNMLIGFMHEHTEKSGGSVNSSSVFYSNKYSSMISDAFTISDIVLPPIGKVGGNKKTYLKNNYTSSTRKKYTKKYKKYKKSNKLTKKKKKTRKYYIKN